MASETGSLLQTAASSEGAGDLSRAFAHVTGDQGQCGSGALSALPRREVLCVTNSTDIQRCVLAAVPDFEVTVVETAGEALREMHGGLFDAFVVDYWLSDWNGPSLCREIRKTDPHVPVCFCTAATKPEHRAR